MPNKFADLEAIRLRLGLFEEVSNRTPKRGTTENIAKYSGGVFLYNDSTQG